jgi:putative MATE family efflux protein
VYNIVDTAFVINMGEDGVAGNLALTYAFPIQILIIAVGVGTGVGVNALLSKSLGEHNREKVNSVAGNAIFLSLCVYAVFLLFGLFGARAFIAMQADGDALVTGMGASYLQICCCFSFGAVGFTIYERFLQSTGKTLCSTIAQISGAIANIVLDYIFIYPCGMGVQGAAWATVIGQVLALAIAMIFHYLSNKEIGNGIRYLKPNGKIIGGIYHIGLSAALMQALLAVMMLCVTMVLGTAPENVALLKGSFGIYYKIMQFALFACFGLSNTIITVLSFNFGAQNKARSRECVKWGVIDGVIVAGAIAVLFEILALPLADLFALAGGESGEEIKNTVVFAVRIAAIGYVFMGISVSIQGVLQALRYALYPLLISALRLIVFVLPLVFLFTRTENAPALLWWAFPVAEFLTSIVACILLKHVYRKDIQSMNE